MSALDKYTSVLRAIDPIKYRGRVQRVQGLLVESLGPLAVVGEVCQIAPRARRKPVWAEVVGLHDHTVQLMPFEDIEGIEVGTPVVASGASLSVPVAERMLGRVVDAMGKPMDGRGDLGGDEQRSIFGTPPDVLTRRRITEPIATGIRAMDGLITAGKGQRLGIFSGSGVGKSTLLGMIARNTSADVNVIALIGERGREVREFLENDLGREGLARSVVVVASSDKPPLARIRGAYVATTIAEYFRDLGADVMLLFDSVTRFARAQREIGLARGEPPANRGYTPSVFSTLPKLLERAGTSERGTITAFYSILVEGDDLDEPVSDTVRGILDGHVVLSRALAERAQYPAVDVLRSISRLANVVTGPAIRRATSEVRRLMAVYAEAEDLINVGAYVQGTNPEIDRAIEKIGPIRGFLRQAIEEKADLGDTFRRLAEIAEVELPETVTAPDGGEAAGAMEV